MHSAIPQPFWFEWFSLRIASSELCSGMTLTLEKLAAIRNDLAKKRSCESDLSLDDIAALHEVSKGKVVQLWNTGQTEIERVFSSDLKRQKTDNNAKSSNDDSKAKSSSQLQNIVTVWGTVICVRPRTTDLTQQNEILKKYSPQTNLGRVYFGSSDITWTTIDVGGNIGSSTNWLKHQLAGRVEQQILIEPLQENMDLCRINAPDAVLHLAALVPESCRSDTVHFFKPASEYNKYRGSLFKYRVHKKGKNIQVNTIKLSAILAKVSQKSNGLYMKWDAEGIEEDLPKKLNITLDQTFPKMQIVVIVGEASWDNTKWSTTDFDAWWQSFKEVEQKSVSWLMVAAKTSKPPFGASTEPFVRMGKNAASRFEVVYVRRDCA